MFRQASRLLARTTMATISRRSQAFSTDVPATPAQDSNFIKSLKKVCSASHLKETADHLGLSTDYPRALTNRSRGSADRLILRLTP
ncbi:hypothetical protein DITRI_Ditri14bG0148700 [Diplodiscus trichospermus]